MSALTGSKKANVIIGDDGKDFLNGTGRNDAIYGKGGNDQLFGHKGDDVLNGGAGNDWLFGGKGDDWLSGGIGNDLLLGGDGNDAFAFGAGVGRDTISDFSSGEDLIIIADFRGDFDDLSITGLYNATTQVTIISWAAPGEAPVSITLTDVDSRAISADDFAFVA